MSITDYLDCMPQTVTLAAKSGRDGYGAPSYASGTDYRARVVYKDKLIRRQEDGEVQEIAARGHVWFGPPTSDLTDTTPPIVNVGDKITLPDSTAPPVILVEQFPDEDGLHHVKAYFQ